MSSIGTRIKEWRKSNNLTTTDISDKTGISQSVLSSYENDKSIIGGKALIQLYRNFDIDITWILTGEKKNTVILTQNEEELLQNFTFLPEREQIKFIGKIEEIAKQYRDTGKSLDSKIG